MIRLEGLEKHYYLSKEPLQVLHNIDLQIYKGEFIAIMGPSGSGKSTLMNIIGCLDKPTRGHYWLHEQLISEYNDIQLARIRNQHIGFVFQQFQLLPRLNALQNVTLPMIYGGISKKKREQQAIETLDKLGLATHVKHLPTELSGGQKQRVAIARAIVNNPQIILADEPTGALDTQTGRQIMELFTMLHREKETTIVLVTHDHEVATYADRIVFIRDGTIIDEEKGAKES